MMQEDEGDDLINQESVKALKLQIRELRDLHSEATLKHQKLAGENESKTEQIERILKNYEESSKELQDLCSNIELIKITIDNENRALMACGGGEDEYTNKQLDSEIELEFDTLEAYISGQVLDDLKANYSTSLFSNNQMRFSYIIVKWIKTDPFRDSVNLNKLNGAYASFRITKSTDFSSVLHTACRFFTLIEQEYMLTDQSLNSLFAYEDTVCKYTQNLDQTDPIVFLVKIPKNLERPTSSQLASINIGKKDDDNLEGQDYQYQLFKKSKVGLIDSLKAKAYGIIDGYQVVDEEKAKKVLAYRHWRRFEKHICTFLVFTLFFIIVGISISYKKSSSGNFWAIRVSEYNYLFGAAKALDYTAENKKRGEYLPDESISSRFHSVKEALLKSIYPLMLKKNVEDLYVIGNINVLMVKDKLAKCDRVSQQCFQNGDHNKTTLRFLTPEFGPTKDWMYFQSASQNKLDWDIQGVYGYYSGDGFLKTFNAPIPNYEKFVEEIEKMEDAGFFSSDVKAIIVEYTVYHPSEDIFVNTHALSENLYNGLSLQYSPKAFAFRPNVLETDAEKFVMTLDWIALIIACGLIAIIILKIVMNFKRASWKRSVFYFLKYIHLIIYLNAGAYIAYLVEYRKLNLDSSDILKNKKTMDYYTLYRTYNAALIYEFISFFCALFYIFNFLKLHRTIAYIYKSINMFMWPFVAVLFIMFTMCLAMLVIIMNIMGSKHGGFRSAKIAIITLLRAFHMGENVGLTDMNNSEGINICLVIFAFSYIIFGMFCFWGIFAAMMMDSARRIRLLEMTVHDKLKSEFQAMINLFLYWTGGAIALFKCKKKRKRH